MNICSLRDFLRDWFSDHNVCECPEFPAALTQGLEHPDILISLFDRQPVSLCVFQMLTEKSFCNLDPIKKAPGLIWLFKPFASDFFQAFTEFLLVIEEKLFPERSMNRFCLSGAIEHRNLLLNRYSLFKILFNGVEVGDCRVVTAVLHEGLSQPAAIVTLDIGLLLRCCNPEAVGHSPEWAGNYPSDFFAALSAFPGPVTTDHVTAEELFKKVQRIVTNAEYTDFNKLNLLILLYNDLRKAFARCEKVRATFCSAVADISKNLAVARNELRRENEINV